MNQALQGNLRGKMNPETLVTHFRNGRKNRFLSKGHFTQA